MEHSRFAAIVRWQLGWCEEMLGTKGEEYSSADDRFHNFKVAAAVDGETPEKALWGMWKKHFVSLKDMVDGTAEGQAPEANLLTEKIGDSINYLLLLKGLLIERADIKTVVRNSTK
jgi:hypothetical protein